MDCYICGKSLDEGEEISLNCFHVFHLECSKQYQGCVICGGIEILQGVKSQEKFSLLTKRIVNSLEKGKNVMINGPGGTGKTYTIEEITRYFRIKKPHIKLAITAMTGVAAMNINGKTLHSWSGMGLADKPVEWYLREEKP